MKKALFTILFMATVGIGYSQTVSVPQTAMPSSNVDVPGQIYLGFGTGINSPTGALGVRFDGKVSDRVMLGVALGSGTWGNKIAFSATFLTKSHWCPNVSFGRAFGVDSVPITRVVNGVTTGTYGVRQEAVNYLSVGMEKQWFTKRGNRLSLNLGYAFSMAAGNPFYAIDKTIVMTPEEKTVCRILSPGGLVVAFGYSFRLK